MLAKNDAQFEEQQKSLDAEPTIQIIAKGSVVDTQQGWNDERSQAVDESFLVETTAIRLNHVALNEWLDSTTSACYPPADYGLSWEEYNARNDKRKTRREALEKRIRDDLGIDITQGSFAVNQIVAEFFAVVTMRKICETPRQTRPAPDATSESSV